MRIGSVCEVLVLSTQVVEDIFAVAFELLRKLLFVDPFGKPEKSMIKLNVHIQLHF